MSAIFSKAGSRQKGNYRFFFACRNSRQGNSKIQTNSAPAVFKIRSSISQLPVLVTYWTASTDATNITIVTKNSSIFR